MIALFITIHYNLAHVRHVNPLFFISQPVHMPPAALFGDRKMCARTAPVPDHSSVRVPKPELLHCHFPELHPERTYSKHHSKRKKKRKSCPTSSLIRWVTRTPVQVFAHSRTHLARPLPVHRLNPQAHSSKQHPIFTIGYSCTTILFAVLNSGNSSPAAEAHF